MKANASRRRLVGASVLGLLTILQGGGGAFAAAFPDPEGNVLTIESGTYDTGTIPATVTRLVKSGTGEATISVDSPNFAGAVEVSGGTLKLTTHQALGPVGKDATGGDVTVASGATLLLAWPKITTSDYLWSKRTVTIAGTGADGAGALRVEPTTVASENDNIFGTIALAGDASVSATTRWGFTEKLALNGHTLTCATTGTDKDKKLMFGGCVAGPGNIVAAGNVGFLPDASFEGLEGEGVARSFTVNAGATVYLYQTKNPIPFDFTILADKAANASGLISSQKGLVTKAVSRDCNVITGDVTLPAASTCANGIYSISGSGYMTWKGAVMQNSLVTLRYGLTLVIAGSFTRVNGERLQIDNTGNLIFAKGAVVRDLKLENWCQAKSRSAVTVEDGDVAFSKLVLDRSTGSVPPPFRQMGGKVTLGSDVKISASTNSSASVYVEGGELVYSNTLYLCANTNAQAFLVQRGGVIRGDGSKSKASYGTSGYSVYSLQNGTNDTTAGSVNFGANASAVSPIELLFDVRGAGSLFKAGSLYFDNDNGDRSLNVSVADGGTLSVERFNHQYQASTSTTSYRHESYFYFDGGVLDIRLPNAINSFSTTDPDSYLIGPTRFVVGPKGIVFDTSNCIYNGSYGQSMLPYRFEKPTGLGVATITLPETDEFKALTYYAPARIKIEGDGTGAAAFADWDFENKKLVVRITNPGCDYTAAGTTVKILSPDLTTWHACGFTLAAQTCGPVTVRGAGGVAFYGAGGTFDGGFVVESGSKATIANANVLPVGTALTVDGTLNVVTNAVIASSLAGSGTIKHEASATRAGTIALAANGTIRVRAADLFAEGVTPLTIDAMDLAIPSGATIVVEDPENLPEKASRAVFLKAKALDVSGTELPRVVDANGADLSDKVTLRVKGNEMSLGVRTGLMLIIR